MVCTQGTYVIPDKRLQSWATFSSWAQSHIILSLALSLFLEASSMTSDDDDVTYAKTSTSVSWSGSASCWTDINLRNSLKDTLQLVLSTDTVLARIRACSSRIQQNTYVWKEPNKALKVYHGLPLSLYPRHLSSFSYSLKFRIPSRSRSKSWYRLCRSSNSSSPILRAS